MAYCSERYSLRELLDDIDEVSKDQFEDNIKAQIYELLDKNEANLSLLVEHYLETFSKRTFKILIGLESPMDEHLFNALLNELNTCQNLDTRQAVLVLLSNIVHTSPSWLPKFINSSSLKQFFAILKNEQEVVILGYAVLILVELVASLPSVITECLGEIFDCFSRLTTFLSIKKRTLHEENVLFLQMNSIVYRLFLRLYGLYPCNFIEYLKVHYGAGACNERAQVFHDIIQPMMGKIRFHPSLIATSLDEECKNTRWFYKETHDILAECALYAIDPIESIPDTAQQPYAQDMDGLDALDKILSTSSTSSSSDDDFISHHETFPIVHRTDNPDVIFNQLNENVAHSKFESIALLSAKNLLVESQKLKCPNSGQDVLKLSAAPPLPSAEVKQAKPTIVIPSGLKPTQHSSPSPPLLPRQSLISPFKSIDDPSKFSSDQLQAKPLTFPNVPSATSLSQASTSHADDNEEGEDEDLEVSQAMSSSTLNANAKVLLQAEHSELVGEFKKSIKKASSRIRYQSHCLPESVPTNDPFSLDKHSELVHLHALSQSCPAFWFENLDCETTSDNSSQPSDRPRSPSESRSSIHKAQDSTSASDKQSEAKALSRKKACKSVDFTKEGQLKYRQMQKQLRQQQNVDLIRLLKAKESVQKNSNNQFTPHELLDRVMFYTSELFHKFFINRSTSALTAAHSASQQIPSSSTTLQMRRNSNASGLSSIENIPTVGYGTEEDMRTQLALMYAQILFETNQRKQHVVRIRRVYRQNKEIVQVQEQLKAANAENKKLNELNAKLADNLHETTRSNERSRSELRNRIAKLEQELEISQSNFSDLDQEKAENEKRFKAEIEDLNVTYRAAKVELDDFIINQRNKNADTAKLQAENLELKNQLIMFGEFYIQMRDSYNKSKSFANDNNQDQHLIEALKHDNKELQLQSQEYKLQIETLNAKVDQLNAQLKDEETNHRTKSDNQEIELLNDKLKMKDAQIDSLNAIVIYYDKYIRSLKGQQAMGGNEGAIATTSTSSPSTSGQGGDVRNLLPSQTAL